MSLIKYILRSLWFYRKQHLALLAGTLISTAVLTGALIVGDSVRYSLKRAVHLRLGEARFAMQTGDRFVRNRLAAELSLSLGIPVIAMNISDGVGVNPETSLQVNKLQVLGIGADFAGFFNVDIPEISAEEALISRNLAEKLTLGPGSTMILRTPVADIIPLNAPFSQGARPSLGLRLTVKEVLDDDQMGRFGLKSNQAAPFNVFVDRDFLAGKQGTDGLANTLLVQGRETQNLSPDSLNELLHQALQLDDISLQITELPGIGKFEVASNRIFIDEPVAAAISAISRQPEPILTYLVNTIRTAHQSTPYSFVSALTPPYVDPDLGPREIVINDWLAGDLAIEEGDSVTLDYFVVGPLQKLQERSHRFVVRQVMATGKGLIDTTLMPDYPGLTEAGNCRDWDTGIPIDLSLIRDKDEFYWDDYKGTPKALISLKTGRELWENDFGGYTAFRFDKETISRETLGREILSGIHPADLNLVFHPVFEEGIQAADNSVDFGELFLSLSFFVIAAGVLLTVLLYSLQARSRMPEAGVLAALGFSTRAIIHVRLAESALVILLGGILGAGASVLYNQGILAGLNSVWQEAVNADMLDIYLSTKTIGIGTLIGIAIGFATVYLITRRKLKQPVSSIIKNISNQAGFSANRRNVLNRMLIAAGFGGTMAMLFYAFTHDMDGSAGLFLTAGAFFMLGCLAWFSNSLNVLSRKVNSPSPGLFGLALKNMARSKMRSMTSVALLALGAFTIIITGANRKTFYGVENDRASGTGGFLFWAETTMPVNEDLSVGEGRASLGITGEESLADASFVQFLTLDGDDASCLNLNQVEQPRILGVNARELDSRNSFSFARLKNGVDVENPWLELQKEYAPDVIPAYADQTVITWGLKKKVGDTLHYLNEKGERIKLLLAGGFTNSIFQGNVLIDQDHFIKHFPSVSGSTVMLIDGSTQKAQDMAVVLQAQLRDFGIDLTRTSRRLAEFNSVENTYLTVFMVLGGLGVIIGTIGLGIVILKNLLERKEELALLAAIGFSRNDLMKLILAENLVLLVSGLVFGILAAGIGILPSLLSPAYAVPGLFMMWLVAGVFFSGVGWIWWPARRMLKKPLITALRNE